MAFHGYSAVERPGTAVRMVHLTTVRTSFHGRVIAARLGADGILAQLRGAVDMPYPVGEVTVWVPFDELAAAQELLQADATDFGAGADPDPEESEGAGEELGVPLRRRIPPLVAVCSVGLAVAGVVAHGVIH